MFGWILLCVAFVGFLISLHYLVKKSITFYILKDVNFRIKQK